MNDQLPDSIRKIVNTKGENQGIYRISFVGDSAGQPFLSQVAKKFKVDVNVLFGNNTELQGIPFGNLVVELRGEASEIKRAIFFIQQEKVLIKEVNAHAS
jgi:D-methionine transport system ATP-binding protein